MSNECKELHKIFNRLKRFSFPFDKNAIPLNGIYVLFQKNEKAHDGDRIVRVGTHTGLNQLPSRLVQHFELKNKDRSIFRKNIGRALLNKRKDSFLKEFEIDLTTKESKLRNLERVDKGKLKAIEDEISRFIQDNFSFVVFRVDDKKKRLLLESRLISTISLCKECAASDSWLGNYSPIQKIRECGLWNVQGLYKETVSEQDLSEINDKLYKEF